MHSRHTPHEHRAGRTCDRCNCAILGATPAQLSLRDRDAPIEARLCIHCTRRLMSTLHSFLRDYQRRT